MAHRMEIIDGLTSFARADCEPNSWWAGQPGLTQQVFAKGSEWQTIAPLANLNHEVNMHEMVTVVEGAGTDGVMWDDEGSKLYRPVRQWQGGQRDGKRELLGKAFTGRYGLVQVAEMAAFAEAIAAIMPGAYIATAGAVRGGNRVFMSVRLGEVKLEVGGFTDTTNLYLSLLNSFDGSAAFVVANGSYRTECDNTFSGNLEAIKAATKGGAFTSNKGVYLKHTGSMTEKLDQAKVAIAAELGWADAYKAYAERLAAVKMSSQQFDRMVKRIFPEPKDANDQRVVMNHERKVAEVKAEWKREVSARGGATAWGALNAFTYLASHHSVSKGTKLSPDVEIESRLFGDTKPAQQSASLIDQVMQYLAEQVEGQTTTAKKLAKV